MNKRRRTVSEMAADLAEDKTIKDLVDRKIQWDRLVTALSQMSIMNGIYNKEKKMKVRSMADSVEKELIAEENDLIREEVKNRIDRVRGVKNKLSNAADSLNYLLDMDIEEARKKLHNGQLQW